MSVNLYGDSLILFPLFDFQTKPLRRIEIEMTIRETFGNNPTDNTSEDTPTQAQPKPDRNARITGKIYHIGDGYAFIESDALPYTRIFCHWQNLYHNTLHFNELKRGMTMEFNAVEELNHKTQKKEWRAQRVKVVNNA